MSFVIGVTVGNNSVMFGDKRKIEERTLSNGKKVKEIFNDTIKIRKINDNILIGYSGIKERCEFYLDQLSTLELSNADNLYKRLCELIVSDREYVNDEINVSNYLIIVKIEGITYHYKLYSYHNHFLKNTLSSPVNIDYLNSSYITEEQCIEIINDEISKKYPSIEDMFAKIIYRVSQVDDSVSELYDMILIS